MLAATLKSAFLRLSMCSHRMVVGNILTGTLHGLHSLRNL